MTRPHRKPTRMRGFDYTSSAACFVTTCTYQRAMLFEKPRFVRIVKDVWYAIPRYFAGVELDAFVVMPNHIHGILVLPDQGEPASVGEGCTHDRSANPQLPEQPSPGVGKDAASLSDVLARFKTVVARRLNTIRMSRGQPVWQRSFHDRIIRAEQAYDRIRNYIIANPMRWAWDPENPDRSANVDEDAFWDSLQGQRVAFPEKRR